jgi:hypothetical protein
MLGKQVIMSRRLNAKRSKVPYMAIYRTPAIWAILVAAFGNFFGTQLSLQFTPIFINKVAAE